MTLIPSSFANEFRRHVVPVLTRVIETQAVFVALGIATLSEARASVTCAAWEQNAAHLPEEHFERLEDWIMDTLCARVAVKQAEIEAQQDQTAHIHTDIERWNAEVVALLG